MDGALEPWCGQSMCAGARALHSPRAAWILRYPMRGLRSARPAEARIAAAWCGLCPRDARGRVNESDRSDAGGPIRAWRGARPATI